MLSNTISSSSHGNHSSNDLKVLINILFSEWTKGVVLIWASTNKIQIEPTANSLRIKPTDVLSSIFIGITTLHVSGSLSVHHQKFLAVYQLWYILCSCDEPYATRSRTDPTPGSKRSSQLHKMYQSRCTAKNSWWWAERLPETCRVIKSIKLEFSASVGFIHKESVAMYGHTIVKSPLQIFASFNSKVNRGD